MQVLHKYVDNTYDRNSDGWSLKYQEEYVLKYGSLNQFREFYLLNDDALCLINQILIKQIEQLRKENNKVNILDIGCGTGHQVSQVAFLCDKCYAFDISKEIIENNKQLNTNVDFHVGDALSHPKYNEKITLAFMGGVLYSISDDINIKKQILNQVSKTLDDNGYFVFYHRGYLNKILVLNEYLRKRKEKKKIKTKQKYAMSFYSDEFIINLLKEQGIKVLKIHKADFAFVDNWKYLKKYFIKKGNKSFKSYENLNLFGKFIYYISSIFFPKLTARSSIFVCVKEAKKINTYDIRNIIKVQEFIENFTKKKIIYVYGSGSFAKQLISNLHYNDKFKVELLLDNTEKDAIENIPVKCFNSIKKDLNPNSVLLIASSFDKEIQANIKKELNSNINVVQIYSKLKKNKIKLVEI
jgi:SAM-dependent methyltransferase